MVRVPRLRGAGDSHAERREAAAGAPIRARRLRTAVGTIAFPLIAPRIDVAGVIAGIAAVVVVTPEPLQQLPALAPFALVALFALLLVALVLWYGV